MKKMTLTDRVCVLCVLTLSSAILISSTVTQEPALACVGEMVAVTCNLSVPSPDDSFIALRTNFLVGTSTALPVATINGNTMLGNVDLSRLTADAPVGTVNNVQGTLNLTSYTLADDGLLLGCTIEHNINGNNNNIVSLVETVNLTQAVPPSSPVVTLSQTENSCSTVLMWSPPDSDRSIISYSVFRDSMNITIVSSTTTQYIASNVTTVRMYYVVATSCAGDTTSNTVSSESIRVPSSPVVTLSQTENSCFNTLISWSTPSSNRSVTSYSVYRNSTLVYNGTDTETIDSKQLNINTVYKYSVVAISCAGSSTAGVNTVSIGVPSSPVVTLSQTDNSCSDTLISWSTPSSDRSVTSYSVYRDSVSVYNGPDNPYTDNTQLNINTVYEYSVVAISCAGNSTAGVIRVKLEYYITSLIVSYDETSGETLLNWVISRDSVLTSVNSLNYSVLFNYTHTRGNNTISSDPLSATFSLLSTYTSYNITKDIQPPSFAGEGEVDTKIRVCIHITEQCGQVVTEMIICNYSDSVIHGPEPTSDSVVVIVAAVVGGCLFCAISALGLTGVTILIIVCVSKKKCKGYFIFNPKKRSETQELQEQMYSEINKENKTSKQQPVEEKMEGLYAEVDHTLPKPDTIKIPEPIEETLYAKVQQTMDGPNQ